MTAKQNTSEAGWSFENSYFRLPDVFFKQIEANPVTKPAIAMLNKPLADSLGLNSEALESEAGVQVLSGSELPEGAASLAQAYAGHQFGHFTMLGDGRALLIGEHMTPSGDRVDIQLKGSGRTPYSRGGDGRAALGPMLREYVISEAMHGLGIPTTRSLAVVTTGETVSRETGLPGAVLARVADSHLRVGTFQYAAQWGTDEDLMALADYAIARHYPDAAQKENRYMALLEEVINRQTALVAKWQLAGFIHGVMNTDNMAISGETIDYGPCAFMDTYEPATVFSSIDVQGRYAYANQPIITGWNLARFAETLLPLLHEEQEQAIQLAQEAVSRVEALYQTHWLRGMREKLGLFQEEEGDIRLINELLQIMHEQKADYTNTFRALTLGELEETALFSGTAFADWYERWQARRGKQAESKQESAQLMQQRNPAVIPRNHRVEQALEAAVKRKDYTVLNELLAVLANPYAYSPEQEAYTSLPEPTLRPYRTYCGT